MPKTNPKIDAYIARAPEYARPILEKLRALYHRACPDIEETIKWGCPHFEYRGLVGGMAAFKQHVRHIFWKASLLKDPLGLFRTVGETCMGAVKVTDVSELPPDKVLVAYIREAIALNEQGVKLPAPKRRSPKALEIPDDFLAALRKNKKALATFEAFPPSHQREYVEWVTEAKQQATRERRLAQAVEWMAEGKPRNWKYQKN